MSGDRLAFLADESCDFAVVRALRAAGYDVRAVSEEQRRSVDDEVIAEAARERNGFTVVEPGQVRISPRPR